jgi:outer membrane receptor protein involved in Fe transport
MSAAVSRSAAGFAGRKKLALSIAAVLSGTAALHAAGVHAAGASSDTLDEIIVTSRKREENLQDVPQSIDVFSAKDLQNLGIANFEDWATKTPTISYISIQPGSQLFMIRGVSDGSNPQYANNSAVAFLVDDMSLSFQSQAPDLHQYDIERIEVLNGPQGTNFGASAMAGAVRIITNKPDLKGFAAGIDLDGGKISGGTYNHTVEGFLNVPLVEGKTALRISVYGDYHGGYINNLATTRQWLNGTASNNSQWAGNDYNVADSEGARIALKQVFSDSWQATLSYTYQRQLAHGAWDEAVNKFGNLPVYGEYNVSRFGPEDRSNYARLADLHVDGDVGIGDLVFASTYWNAPSRFSTEYSEYMQYANVPPYLYAPYLQGYSCKTDPVSSGGSAPYSGCNVPTLWYDFYTNPERYSDELRLQSKPGGSLHWLAGLYWQKTTDPYSIFYHEPGLQTGGAAWQGIASYYGQTAAPPTPDDWYSYTAHNDTRQTTEFANITYDLADQWSLEAGLVHFQSSFDHYLLGGFTYTPTFSVPNESSGSANKWDTKLGVNYKPSTNMLVYAAFSQGFRDGGANAIPEPTCKAAPSTYKPDTLNNFEIGWKWQDTGHRMQWNGSIYDMEWKNLQSSLYDPEICPPVAITTNIGNARVQGVDSNIEYRLSEGLTIKAAGSYNSSTLLSNSFANTPTFQVNPGERLPYVPYVSYSANARYERPVADGLKGYGQFDIAHKGDVWNDIRAVSPTGFPRVLQPQYNILNLRAGLSQGAGGWLTELYIANLLNKNAVIYTNTNSYDLRQTVNEPRVVGIRLSYRFGGK